jgi:chitinase
MVNCASEAAMSRYFQTIVKIALLLPLVLPLSPALCQSVKQAAISVTVDPPEATVHVGQMQRFTAVTKGSDGVGIRWGVEEPDGGRITEDGVYTAPRRMGIYHVVATSKADPRTRAVAKVTVVTEYDTPPEQ